MEMTQEPGPSYEDLLKSNEELKEKQSEIEKKLKLSYSFISSILRNNSDAKCNFEKISGLCTNDLEMPFIESDNTDLPSSQSQFDQSDDVSQEFEVLEPSPRKILFQESEKQYQCHSLSFQKMAEDRSPGIIEYRNTNFPSISEVSPFNFNILNSTKQDGLESWDSVISDMMLTGNFN